MSTQTVGTISFYKFLNKSHGHFWYEIFAHQRHKIPIMISSNRSFNVEILKFKSQKYELFLVQT